VLCGGCRGVRVQSDARVRRDRRADDEARADGGVGGVVIFVHEHFWDRDRDGQQASREIAKDLAEKSSMASATASNGEFLLLASSRSLTSSGYAYPPKPSELPNVPRPVKQPQPQSEGVDWFREALPMELRIVTGSIVLGSDATPMVLIGDFKRAEGVVEVAEVRDQTDLTEDVCMLIVQSRSACDKYKLSIDLSFQDPKVLMRTNVDWSGPSLAHGKKVYDELLKQK
jgi:hypothetical protein